ncbi:hypothetical protein K0B03_03155 [Patescibacteria group bacterium]|nr:hypothetical protein [Patescibacteria group bacterium]
MNFPSIVFEDVSGYDFSKHNKKHVTEDFVSENFKELGWNVYRPFNDTGIDLIIIKRCCPRGHEQIDESANNEVCSQCGNDLVHIKRFIQVKTREIKGKSNSSQFFGYTLKSKDFRTDPRHVFLLYSDYTNDFLIIPMYEYLKIFYENKELGKSHFGTPSFRKGNNKLNSLRKHPNGQWVWKSRNNARGISFDKFVNKNGLKLMSNPDYDINVQKYAEQISEMKLHLFYTYSHGRQFNKELEKEINNYLSNKVKDNIESISSIRSETRKKLRKELSSELIDSIENGYLVKFEGVSFYD